MTLEASLSLRLRILQFLSNHFLFIKFRRFLRVLVLTRSEVLAACMRMTERERERERGRERERQTYRQTDRQTDRQRRRQRQRCTKPARSDQAKTNITCTPESL